MVTMISSMDGWTNSRTVFSRMVRPPIVSSSLLLPNRVPFPAHVTIAETRLPSYISTSSSPAHHRRMTDHRAAPPPAATARRRDAVRSAPALHERADTGQLLLGGHEITLRPVEQRRVPGAHVPGVSERLGGLHHVGVLGPDVHTEHLLGDRS